MNGHDDPNETPESRARYLGMRRTSLRNLWIVAGVVFVVIVIAAVISARMGWAWPLP